MGIALLRVLAAPQDAGLVEVYVRVDEAGADQPATALHLVLGCAAEVGGKGRDPAVLDADVRRRLVRLVVGQAYIAQDEIEIHRKRGSPLMAACMLHHTASCCLDGIS